MAAAPENGPTMHLPAGWRRVASKSHPGEYYYVSPAGPTWRPPPTGTVEPFATEQRLATTIAALPRPPSSDNAQSPSGSARRKRFEANSLYRQDFKQHDPREALIERADRLSRYNPSCAPHPKAQPKACNFVSVARADYVSHAGVKPEPPTHQWSVPVPVAPLGETSTHRADFVRHEASRGHQYRRPRTPPKPTPFEFNSTQRASYSAAAAGVDPASLSSPRHRELPQVAATKPDMTTYGFNDAAYLASKTGADATPSPRASRPPSASPRRLSAHQSTPGLLGLSSPRMRRTDTSQYRANYKQPEERPRNRALEARDYVYRAWKNGLNPSTPDQFTSLQRASYRDETRANKGLLKECREVDDHVIERAKAHQEFEDP